MKLLKRLYSQLKQKATTGIRHACSMSNMTSKTGNVHPIAQQGIFYLAPPWNLMLALPTVAAQSTVLTAGRPVSSALMAMLVAMVSPFTFKSKEPLSFLLRERSHCCSRSITKWIELYGLRKKSFLTHIIRRYLTLQFPCRLMKALPMDSLTPVPGTRSTADCGNPTSTICILEETTCLFVKAVGKKIPP